MTAILTTLLGGGWGLVAGWVLPTALNSVLLGVLILPALHHVAGLQAAASASSPAKALGLLAAAVIGGLLLSALQTPLYRVLEGYLGMPPAVKRWRIRRHTERKKLLEQRLRLARLARREAQGRLPHSDVATLAAARADPALRKVPENKRTPTPLSISVLAERRRRYPVDDGQILPTMLGNAIRHFEEYAYDRYHLDAVTMWYALVGAAPDGVSKQVDTSRVGVDFFVCLIYGHVILAACGIATLIATPGHPAGPIVAIALPVVLIPLWYRLAVEATDEWAAAFRGLIDIGRKPLAEALGLEVPATLEQERRMWELASRLTRRPYSGNETELDRFRAYDGDGRRRPVPAFRGGPFRPRG